MAPEHVPPAVGSYLTDETRFCEVLEADRSGAILEDQVSHRWFELSLVELEADWRPVSAERT